MPVIRKTLTTRSLLATTEKLRAASLADLYALMITPSPVESKKSTPARSRTIGEDPDAIARVNSSSS